MTPQIFNNRLINLRYYHQKLEFYMKRIALLCAALMACSPAYADTPAVGDTWEGESTVKDWTVVTASFEHFEDERFRPGMVLEKNNKYLLAAIELNKRSRDLAVPDSYVIVKIQPIPGPIGSEEIVASCTGMSFMLPVIQYIDTKTLSVRSFTITTDPVLGPHYFEEHTWESAKGQCEILEDFFED